MTEATDIKEPFREVFDALDLREQRKALRGAMRREGNRLRTTAAAKAASALGNRGGGDFKRNIIVRVYPPKYGAGFMLTVKGRNGHDPKIMHKTGDRVRKRDGKRVAGGLKPILMWAEDGTRPRRQGRRKGSGFGWAVSAYGRRRRDYRRGGRRTGAMPRYGFLSKTEAEQSPGVERRLFDSFRAGVERAAKKKGLL